MMLRAKFTVAFALLVLFPALNANASSEKDKDLAEIGDVALGPTRKKGLRKRVPV